MKKFYFLMCMTALLGLLTVSCKKDNGGNDGNGDGSKLAAPVITEENIEILSTTSAKVKWEAVANAESYTFMIGSEFKYSEKGATEITLENLKLGKNEIKVKSVAAVGSGYEDSDFATFTINIESEYSPKYEEYFGTWEIVPTQMIQYDMYAENPADAVFSANTDPLTVYIQEAKPLPLEDGSEIPAFWVLGLTQYDADGDDKTQESVQIASYNYVTNEYDDKGNVTKELFQLEMLNNMYYTDPNEEGYSLTTMAISTFNGDKKLVAPVGGVYCAVSIRLTDADGNAQFQLGSGILSDKSTTFEVQGIEHFLHNEQTSGIRGFQYEYYLAGPYTGKRVSTEVPSGAAFREYNTDQLSKGQVVKNIESALASSKPSVLVSKVIVK